MLSLVIHKYNGGTGNRDSFSGHRSRLQVRVREQVRVSGPGPVPEPEQLNQRPDGRDLGPESFHDPSQSSGFRSPFERPTANRQPLTPVTGRAVIAMTAVRRRACREPARNTDHSDVRPPTDVMAITSLPGVHYAANAGIRLCRDAVPTLPENGNRRGLK